MNADRIELSADFRLDFSSFDVVAGGGGGLRDASMSSRLFDNVDQTTCLYPRDLMNTVNACSQFPLLLLLPFLYRSPPSYIPV